MGAALAGLLLSACFSDSVGAPDGGDGTPDSGTEMDAAGQSDSTVTETGSPATDGSTATADAVAPADGSLADGGADATCDALPTVPDLTTGAWLICNALDVNGRIWTGTLTITSETPVCSGATLAGSFHWVSTNLGAIDGTTVAQGSYDAASAKITLTESQPTGSVISGTDVMTYDPGTDRLVNGSWTPVDGSWSAATRVSVDAGTSCGDGG